jgi:hypothetical protein
MMSLAAAILMVTKGSLMSNLTPQQVVDKNGRTTTVHKNLDKGTGGVSDRASGVAHSAPAPAAVERPEVVPFEFDNQVDRILEQDRVDARDLQTAFEDFSQQMSEYITSAVEADPSIEDDADVRFDDESEPEAEDLLAILDKHRDILNEMGVGGYLEKMQGATTPENLREYADDIAGGWDEVQNQHGPTLIKDTELADYAEEFAEEIGAIPDEMPEWLKNNIDWEAASESLFDESPTFQHEDDTFYLV